MDPAEGDAQGPLLTSDFGIDLTGWRLFEAVGVSGDGRTIAGNGLNPAGQLEAWVAVVPEPLAMPLAALAAGAGGLRRRRAQ